MTTRIWTQQRDAQLREEAIDWLNLRTNNGLNAVTRAEILDFHFESEPFRLQATQQGIHKPRMLEAALSIQTVFRPPGKARPYEDDFGENGQIRYKWRGDDPYHADNRALRVAMERRLPIIWFVGVGHGPSTFIPICPVYIISEEEDRQRFVLAAIEQDMLPPASFGNFNILEDHLKKYLERQTKVRLHQPVFRSTVLRAYADRCAVCNLGHRELLDAAHIVPDSHEKGVPSVTNGLALCKIHHAAFDTHILGIRPDLTVQIRRDLLHEVDGPMLQHGLKERHGERLMAIPRSKHEQPSKDHLDIAYQEFLSATAA